MIDNYQLSVKVILRNEEGKILSFVTKPEWGFGGLHDVPGGRVDVDEFNVPLLDVLSREIAEETGSFDFKIYPSLVGVSRGRIMAETATDGIERHIVYLFYVAEWMGKDAVLSDEHLGVEWLDPKRVETETLFIPPIQEGVQQYISSL